MPTRTLQDIANWVTRKLSRDDVNDDAIEEAADFYVLLTARVPFPELREITDERAMVADQVSYDLSDLDDLAGIHSLRLTLPNGNVRRLKRSSERKYDAINYSSSGQPASYARAGLTLEFQPPPNSSSYTYRLRYWKRATLAENYGETEIITPFEWDSLIKWETLYRVYFSVGMEEKAMLLKTPTNMPRQAWAKKTWSNEVGIIPTLWNDLLLTIPDREQIDEDLRIGVRSTPMTWAG